MKIHWIRKHKSKNPIYGFWDTQTKYRWYFDWNSACGRNMIEAKQTTIRKNVTCKKCLAIMKKKGMLP